MGKWLTPDDNNPAIVAYRVFLPDDRDLRAAFYGAFLMLCQAYNWEEFGTMTPAQAALLFENCWIATHPYNGDIAECP